MRQKGFTLTELMVTLSIFGLVLALATPPIIGFLRRHQSTDSATIVMGVLRQARSRAIQEKNDYVVFFDIAGNRMTILDDDGGGNGVPSDPGFNPTSRNNGQADAGEKVMGPYELPEGQVFGMIAGTVDGDGGYVTRPVTFSGNPPRVVFHANGSTNEEGLVLVMPQNEFHDQKRGTDQMMIVRRSTGSVILRRPDYN